MNPENTILIWTDDQKINEAAQKVARELPVVLKIADCVSDFFAYDWFEICICEQNFQEIVKYKYM